VFDSLSGFYWKILNGHLVDWGVILARDVSRIKPPFVFGIYFFEEEQVGTYCIRSWNWTCTEKLYDQKQKHIDKH